MVRCHLLITIVLSAMSCGVAAQPVPSSSAAAIATNTTNATSASSGALAEVHRLHYAVLCPA